MRGWLRLMIDLFCLRAGPAEFPYSVNVFILLFFINIFFASYWQSERTTALEALLGGCSLIALHVIYTYGVLRIRGLSTRFLQTAIALLSLDVLAYLLLFPLIIISPYIQQYMKALPKTPSVSSLLVLMSAAFLVFVTIAVITWTTLIAGHVYRRALNVHFVIGVLVVIALMGLEVLLFQ